MTTATMRVPTEQELQRSVEEELKWEPSINAREIGVTVKDGVITLSGVVNNFFEKWEATTAAERVHGVKAIANDIEVRLAGNALRSDVEIARAAAEALAWNASVPQGRVKVVVSDGCVTLDGEVDWRYQKVAAENAVRCLFGVKGVVDQISVRPRSTPAEIKSLIEAAFRRSAMVDAGHIWVESDGAHVTLHGEVRSWAERSEAERTAWSAPGISNVENHIIVAPTIA